MKSEVKASSEPDAALALSVFFFVRGYWTIVTPPPPEHFSPSHISFFALSVLDLLYTMALWRGLSQQLCKAVPRAGETYLAQSRRYVSHSAAPRSSRGITNRSRWNTSAQNNLRTVSPRWNLAQRGFSGTAHFAHGHITPPKPGEE